MNWELLYNNFSSNQKYLARCISLIENESEGYEAFLQKIKINNTPIIGITGPPGAGKSTLTDAIISNLIANEKKVAILCVDPSSPFNFGALLGDRIRMSNWYNHPNVYIRSLATRGALGGLHPKIIEITELLKAAAFDYIIVETVGVGQSEVEIAGLANITMVVLVPEAGDEVQTMKAGLMEIANIFVVNKADRPEANVFVKNLQQMLAPVYKHQQWQVPILKTIASQKIGIDELLHEMDNYLALQLKNDKQAWLQTQRIFQIIQNKKMNVFNKTQIKSFVEKNKHKNLYQLVSLIMQNENLPKIAGKGPTAVQVEAGKTYAWCTCGLSEKQPLCDGQHKQLATEENGEIVMPYKSMKISFEETKEVWLCNCKQTKNPPYCDGSHNSL